MKTIKEYWPLLLLILVLIGFAIYWFFFRNKSTSNVDSGVTPTPSDPLIGSEVKANKDSVNIYTDAGTLSKTVNKGEYIGTISEKINGGSLFPGKIMYKINNPVSGRDNAIPYFLVWNQDVEKITYS